MPQQRHRMATHLYILVNGGQRGHDEIVQVALPPTIVNTEDGDHS